MTCHICCKCYHCTKKRKQKDIYNDIRIQKELNPWRHWYRPDIDRYIDTLDEIPDGGKVILPLVAGIRYRLGSNEEEKYTQPHVEIELSDYRLKQIMKRRKEKMNTPPCKHGKV